MEVCTICKNRLLKIKKNWEILEKEVEKIKSNQLQRYQSLLIALHPGKQRNKENLKKQNLVNT